MTTAIQTSTLKTVRGGGNLLVSLWKITESLSLEQISESNLWLITIMATRPRHTTRPSCQTKCHIQSFPEQLQGWWLSTTSLSTSCHCLTSLPMKKFLLMSTWISLDTTLGYVLSSWKFQISVRFILKLPKPYAESKDYISAWRRECSKGDLRAPSTTYRRPTRDLEKDFLQGHVAVKQVVMALNWA